MRRLAALVVSLGLLVGCGESRGEGAPPSPAPAEQDQTEQDQTEQDQTEQDQAEQDQAEQAPPEVERPYEDGADAAPRIEAALERARTGEQKVLLMFGANWCVWCRRLDWVFQNDPAVSAALRERWQLVHVDVGTRGSGTNAATVARYGDPVQHGLPCLVVLDATGAPLHTQETGALESGARHDPARVLAFLDRFAPPRAP